MSSKGGLGNVLNCANSIYRVSLYFITASSLSAFSVAPIAAKDRAPEPLEDPGECPVDAPIRVASVDSLRHFEGLVGHCPETILIESPAFKANRPRGEVRATSISEDGEPIRDRAPAEQDTDRDPRFILAAKAEGRNKKTAEIEAMNARIVATKSFTLANGSIIAIVPPEDASRPYGADDYGLVQSSGDDLAAEAAVLALRPQSYGTQYDDLIDQAARSHRIDPLLLHAVIKQESRYHQRAVSSAGALGLMQVMPGTGRDLGVSDAGHLFDPATNINAGAKLLSQLWQRLDGNLELVLAAYNAGEGAVRKHGMRIPPYRETQDYVAKVKANYAKLASENGIVVNF
ncbi:MAG: lytic transglycosylase domain-containing protein [Pseudomonadota bacterium]